MVSSQEWQALTLFLRSLFSNRFSTVVPAGRRLTLYSFYPSHHYLDFTVFSRILRSTLALPPCPSLLFVTESQSTFEILPAGLRRGWGWGVELRHGTTLIKHCSQILGPHSHSCWKDGPEGPCWMPGKLADAADAVWIWRAGDCRGSEPSACVGGTPLASALRGRSVQAGWDCFPITAALAYLSIGLLIISK